MQQLRKRLRVGVVERLSTDQIVVGYCHPTKNARNGSFANLSAKTRLPGFPNIQHTPPTHPKKPLSYLIAL